MNNALLSSCLLFGATQVLAAETSYECESKVGQRVLIEIESNRVAMTVENAGQVGPGKALSHHFSWLSPFREASDGVLLSVTDMAQMDSRYPALDGSEGTWTKTQLFAFVTVRIDMTDESAAKVFWRLRSHGISEEYEVICDQKGRWTSLN